MGGFHYSGAAAALLLLSVAFAAPQRPAAALSLQNPLLGRRAPPHATGEDPPCSSGFCAGQAHYNSHKTHYYAEFPTPGLPKTVTEEVGGSQCIYLRIHSGFSHDSLQTNQGHVLYLL